LNKVGNRKKSLIEKDLKRDCLKRLRRIIKLKLLIKKYNALLKQNVKEEEEYQQELLYRMIGKPNLMM
jgi:hypothetical protein